MLQDPRAQTMVARFHDEWLHLYKLEDAVKDFLDCCFHVDPEARWSSRELLEKHIFLNS